MKKYYVALLGIAMAVFSCKEPPIIDVEPNVDKPGNVEAVVEDVKFEGVKCLKEGYIFQDGEADAVVMDRNLRWWNLMEPIRAEAAPAGVDGLTERQIVLTSYALKDVQKLTVFAGEEALFTVDNLPALAQFVYELPEGFDKTGKTFSVKSNDEFFKKLTSVKTNWNVAFDNKTSTAPLDCGALEARVLIAYITDMAYTMSCPEFKVLLDNYEAITYGKFKSDAGDYDLSPGSEHRNKLENEIYKPAGWNFSLGLMDHKSTAGQAYTGTGRLAVNPREIARHYNVGAPVGYHEFGHTINYGHASSFSLYDTRVTYENQNDAKNLPDDKRMGSFREYLCGLHATLVRFGMAPYCDDDILEGYLDPKYDAVRKSNKVIASDDTFRGEVSRNDFQRNYVKYYQKYNNGVPVINQYTTEPQKISQYLQATAFDGEFYLNTFEKSLYRGNAHYFPELSAKLEPYFKAAEEAGLVKK